MTTWDNNLVVIGAAIAVLLALIVLRFGLRRQRVSLSDQPAATERRSFGPRDLPGAAPAPLAGDATLAAATLDTAPPLDLIAAETADAGEPLTTLKGLGPKAATRLAELGVTRMDQLAALDAAAAERLDEQMGPFRGRLARDRWIEQARLLTAGDRAGFEAQFGKIG